MINIVYPLINSGWDELKYSLRSLEQHFKEDFEVTVIGDYEPTWINNVSYIKTPRYSTPNADTGSKLRLCTLIFDNFIWMNDDIYLAKDTTLAEMKTIYAKEKYSVESHKGANAWIEIATKSYDAVAKVFPEKTLFNYVTHTPFYFESDKLIQVNDILPIFDGSLDAIICYLNVTGPERPKKLKDRFLFSVPFTAPERGYRYLNHAENALSGQAKEYLQTMFYTPSKFEKVVPAEKLDFDVRVAYIGAKQNYVYGSYDFSSGYAVMPIDKAKHLVNTFPRTFRIG